ncbi:hypothetical protein [Mycobacterium interjectum]|uniref:hypothetical protein n=1 Tax=Mycobacterium interjectum TaxID=33895 RepID=UPI001155467F|nr:hypothetical protein [Mycobacterium interjectum]MCV7093346.1 hypothetical protein [Mycobacterium interjectum]
MAAVARINHSIPSLFPLGEAAYNIPAKGPTAAAAQNSLPAFADVTSNASAYSTASAGEVTREHGSSLGVWHIILSSLGIGKPLQQSY